MQNADTKSHEMPFVFISRHFGEGNPAGTAEGLSQIDSWSRLNNVYVNRKTVVHQFVNQKGTKSGTERKEKNMKIDDDGK